MVLNTEQQLVWCEYGLRLTALMSDEAVGIDVEFDTIFFFFLIWDGITEGGNFEM